MIQRSSYRMLYITNKWRLKANVIKSAVMVFAKKL